MSFDLLKELRHVKPFSLDIKGSVYATLKTLCSFINQRDFLTYKRRLKEGSTIPPFIAINPDFKVNVAVISAHTGFSVRTIKYHLEKLKEKGLIDYKRFKKNEWLYTISVDKVVSHVKKSLSGGAKTTPPEIDQSEVAVQFSQSGGAIFASSTQAHSIYNNINNINNYTKLDSTNTRETKQKFKPTDNQPVNNSTISPLFENIHGTDPSLSSKNKGEFYFRNSDKSVIAFPTVITDFKTQIDQKVPDESSLHKTEEDDMRNHARFYAKELRDKLVNMRKEFGLTFNQIEEIELNLIAARLKRLVDVEKSLEKAVHVCHAVIDSSYHAIKKCKDLDKREEKLKFFCVQLLFVNEKTFNIARSALKNDSFKTIEQQTKEIESKRKKRLIEWEKARDEDEGYLKLKNLAELAKKAWFEDPTNFSKVDACRMAEQRVETYERNFLLGGN